MRPNYFFVIGIVILGSGLLVPAATPQNGHYSRNEFGVARTVSSNGRIDMSGPFFQSLGTNGRSCETCHRENQGWGIS
ncbi:MAG: hypothetical protein WCG75_02315, partial [Armatimonadota bacterium]